jgi:hypothetical protein
MTAVLDDRRLGDDELAEARHPDGLQPEVVGLAARGFSVTDVPVAPCSPIGNAKSVPSR